MEADDSIDRPKATSSTHDRKSRKIHRDEEKQRRIAKRLADKQRSDEEYHQKLAEKQERKNLERMEKLERHQRRYQKIRQVLESLDPANLNTSAGPSTVPEASASAADPNAIMQPSAETIRLLSQAIAGCLQPCNLINKVLGEILKMVPQPTVEPSTSAQTENSNIHQEQPTDTPKQNTATNTSNLDTPNAARPSNEEIEALFKEAAKELEKMNEIVNAGKMEGSTSMTSSSGLTGITQIERVFDEMNESAISNATMVHMSASQVQDKGHDAPDASEPVQESEIPKIATPPKSMRSRESSIEVHDVNSIMSDDSRDWTILDAALDQDAFEITSGSPMRIVNPMSGAIPKGTTTYETSDSENEKSIRDKSESLKSVTIETQTAESTKEAQDKSCGPDEAVASTSLTQKSIEVQTIDIRAPEMVHKSIETIDKPVEEVLMPAAPTQQQATPPKPFISIPLAKVETATRQEPEFQANKWRVNYPSLPPVAARQESLVTPTAPPRIEIPPAVTPANLKAAQKKPTGILPAVVVYDPNPKINASVHTMMNMGFSNEGKFKKKKIQMLVADKIY